MKKEKLTFTIIFVGITTLVVVIDVVSKMMGHELMSITVPAVMTTVSAILTFRAGHKKATIVWSIIAAVNWIIALFL